MGEACAIWITAGGSCCCCNVAAAVVVDVVTAMPETTDPASDDDGSGGGGCILYECFDLYLLLIFFVYIYIQWCNLSMQDARCHTPTFFVARDRCEKSFSECISLFYSIELYGIPVTSSCDSRPKHDSTGTHSNHQPTTSSQSTIATCLTTVRYPAKADTTITSSSKSSARGK